MTDEHPRPPGYRRESADGGRPGFVYRDDSSTLVTDEALLARFRALAIPPAWRDVWIAPGPGDKIQVVGVDRAGRTQYRYSPEWTALRSADKFAHIGDFAAALPVIRSRVRKTLGRTDTEATRDRVLALAVRLLDRGFFRVGSERYAHDNDTYGLTTLQRRHVRVDGDVLHFDYVAKEHRHRVVDVTDRVAARWARLLVGRDDASTEFLAWRRPGGDWQALHSSHVNAYLHAGSGIDATAKQFRTWAGTVLAAAALGGARHEETARNPVSAAVRATSRLLGNTPAVARTSYIHPGVLTAFAEGRTIAPAVSAAAGAMGDDRLAVVWREPAVQAAVADLLADETPRG